MPDGPHSARLADTLELPVPAGDNISGNDWLKLFVIVVFVEPLNELSPVTTAG